MDARKSLEIEKERPSDASGFCRGPRELAAGVVLVVASLFAIWATSRLNVGELSEIGPRFMPLMAASMTAVFGVALIFLSFFQRGEAIEAITFRGPIIITGSLLCFAYMVRPFGLFPASMILVLLSGLATREVRMRELIPFSIVSSLLISIMFKYALEVRLDFVGNPF
ncbi:putative tricarboxylic transport membrane protein [Neorhizobium galegae]|uniref:tripartite tricarboxylate transporter TctB family protein n=1 Tax=Neorhizobium galegae TaxID=399 RepID=UPI00278597CF|nr:tripartite tricarboxylate transporter TctB family protein [Neorhizobium galegae]MDQ0137742.1 putative tricarboxylic transport membrane protein [Neorhizobium galegae]